MFKLSCIQGEQTGKDYVLEPDKTYNFGRGANCEFCIRDVSLSRMHFRIKLEHNIATIEDLLSSNGTFVNDRRVASQILQPGDKIQVGQQIWAIAAALPELASAEQKIVANEATTVANEAIMDTATAIDWISQGKPIQGQGRLLRMKRLVLGYSEAEFEAKVRELGQVDKAQGWFREHRKVLPGLTLENCTVEELVCCGVEFRGPVHVVKVHFEQAWHAGEQQVGESRGWLGGASFQDFVEIQDCVFDGEANFVSVAAAYHVVIKGCEFRQTANFSSIQCAKSLHFVTSHFGGDMMLRYAKLSGEVGFTACTFAAHFDLGRSTLQEAFSWCDCVLQKSAKWTCRLVPFAGDMKLTGSKLEGDVDLTGCTFAGELVACRTTWHGKVTLDQAKFASNVDFSDAKLLGPFSCAATIFNKTIWEEASFAAEVSFAHAHFTGDALFKKARFDQAVSFANARFEGMAMFSEATDEIMAQCRNSSVSPEAAQFSQPADFSGTLFYRKAVFCQVSFHGATSFSGSYFAEAANFQHARFLADAVFTNVFCAQELNLQGAACLGALQLDHANIASRLNLGEAVLTGGLSFYQAVLDVMVLETQQIIGQLIHSGKHPRHVQAQNFARLKDEYLLLKSSFQQRGQFNEEDWAYRQYKIAERKALSQKYRHWLIGSPAAGPRPIFARLRAIGGLGRNGLSKLFLDAGTGYGTQPWRIAAIALLIILAFAGGYWVANQQALTQANAQAVTVPLLLPGWEAQAADFIAQARQAMFVDYVYFSMTTFVTMGGGDARPNPHSWLRYLVICEAFVGIFMVTLFVGTFTRKIIR